MYMYNTNVCVCVCVCVTLVIHQMHTHHVVISGLSSSNFFTLSHKWHDFQTNVIEHKIQVCFDFFYNACMKHFSF